MSEQPESFPPAEVIIGLDIGTTAAKVSAFGIGSTWRHTVVREYPLLHPKPGWEVQDPQVILAAVLDSLGECVRESGAATVVAISVSSAMHGLIGLDIDRKPLTPLLTWADSRAWQEARELRLSDDDHVLHRTSGTPVHSMSPLVKLVWFAHHDPHTASRVGLWVGLKDWVLMALTGTVATELSSASASGLLDLSTRDWNPDALELAGIEEDQLPPVLPTTAALGLTKSVAMRVGLPTSTPVVLGAGDGPLGNLGTGALTPGVAGLSLGTSGALRMIVDRPVVDPGGRLFCYALTDDAWAIGGAVSNGGVVVRWTGDVFGKDLLRASDGESVDAEMLSLAASVPAGSDGLMMLPYLLAERAPLWDPDLPGAFLGVRREHTRGHFVRAAVEGVALQLSTILTELDRIEPVTSIRATGGVFRSPVWRAILAGVLDRPIVVTGGAEGSALGAAALGLYALGRADTLQGALDLLPGCDDESPTLPEPHDVEVYRRSRTRLGELVTQLEAVAQVFAAQ